MTREAPVATASEKDCAPRCCLPGGSEDGTLALVLALAIVTMLTAVVAIVFQTASSNTSDASFKRLQSQALYAAEGGLDLAMAQIQQATGVSSLPCATNTQFNLSPSPASASVSVTYYGAFSSAAGPTNPIQCSGRPQSQPAAALLVATGTDGKGQVAKQYMEAELELSWATGGTLNDAIYSQSDLGSANSATVVDPTGKNNANVYSGGNITCQNNSLIEGSVTAQGTFTGKNSCKVYVNLTTAGDISLQNSTIIGNSATSTGTTPSGSTTHSCSTGWGHITLTQQAVVDNTAYAYCTINNDPPTSVSSTYVKNGVTVNDLSLTGPAVVSPPTIPQPTSFCATCGPSGPVAAGSLDANWSASTNGSYTNQVNDNDCSTVVNDLITLEASNPGPTLFMTSCPVTWQGNNPNNVTSLANNLAVFSTGGFTMQNSTSWKSTSATPHNLYFIVPTCETGSGGSSSCPSGQIPTTCSSGSPGITLQNNTSFDPTTIDVFFYTPCTMSVANATTGYGQIYAGVVNEQNNFTTYFVPMFVPSLSGGGSTQSVQASVVFERQVTTPPALPAYQAPTLTSGSSTTFTASSPGSFQATATGVPTPTFSNVGFAGCTPSTLPSGVTFTSAGLLSGTPASGSGGTYTVCINASNGVGSPATQTFTLTVDQSPTITSAPSTTFTVSSPGSFQVTATGVPTPSFSNTAFTGCTPSTLPSGVSFTNAGLLSGTPGVSSGGTYTLCINASNGVGSSTTQTFTLTVNQAPAFTSQNTSTFTPSVVLNFQAIASGFPAPTFSNAAFPGCTPSTLPSGVTFSNSGVLSGIPPVGSAQSYKLCLNASNGVSPAATQTFTLTNLL